MLFIFYCIVMDMYKIRMKLAIGEVKAEVYDTAGQEQFQEIRKLNLAGADLVIICYSCDSLTSLENIESRWVPEVKALERQPPYLFVGTKKDLFDKFDTTCVKYKLAADLGIRHKAVEVLECSAKDYGLSEQTMGNVDKVFQSAVKYGLIAKGVIRPKPSAGCCNSCTIL